MLTIKRVHQLITGLRCKGRVLVGGIDLAVSIILSLNYVIKISHFLQIPVLILTIGLADYRGRIITFRVFSGLASVSLMLLIFCITSGKISLYYSCNVYITLFKVKL